MGKPKLKFQSYGSQLSLFQNVKQRKFYNFKYYRKSRTYRNLKTSF